MVLIAVLIVLPLAVGWALGSMMDPDGGMVGLGVATLFLIIMLPIGWFGGKSIILSSVDARPISHDDSPRLFNVVQEMTIAAGLPRPPAVYIIDCDAPNAFALGAPDDAAVAVTSGLLMRLNRDELQGVVAHEIAHVANEDSEFMTLAATLVSITVSLANMAQRGMRFNSGRRRSSSRSDGRGAAIVLLIALVLIILAPFMARMLYLACSRRREFLADACAARFTRYPEGLASALEKIASDADGMQHVGRDVAALCIVNPFRDEGTDIFSTHPLTSQRVKVLRSMAGGAGIAEYDRAYWRVTGERVMTPAGLQGATDEPIRPPATEDAPAPMARAREAVDILHRNEGALFVDCPCGVRIKRPAGAAGVTVPCPRCGHENTLPLAMPVKEADGERPAFVYQPGRWQSVQCSCGGVIQLSPNFIGTQVPCPRCGAVTEVIREEGERTAEGEAKGTT